MTNPQIPEIGPARNKTRFELPNLEIDPDVTLYPGTKHSTMTAMSQVLTPEQVRKGGSRHASKAMDRYIIPSDRDGDLYQDTLRRVRDKGKAEIVEIKKRGKK